MKLSISAALLALSLGAAAAEAQPPAPGPAQPPEAAPARQPNVSVTRHSGTFGGQRMGYVATAGETFLKAEDGTPRAAIFSISYVMEPRDSNRPISFLFNVGP